MNGTTKMEAKKLALKIDQVIGSFALTQQQPARVQKRNLVELGLFIDLLTIRTNTALCE
jgi:hypothetical protein